MERCENCKYYADLKLHKRYVKELGGNGIVCGWTVGKKENLFSYSNCCLMFTKTENEPYILEVDPNDMCEMFTPKQ